MRKLYVGSLEDEEEKKKMMTPEEIAKVTYKSSWPYSTFVRVPNFQANMDKIQRKELKQARNEIKRAENAKEANALSEAEKCYELAQLDAEKAYEVVETYAEKVEAARLRVEAVLGRY